MWGMLHVKQIRTIVDAGHSDEAHKALDELLALGPNNTEALKLRASLLEQEGRFAEEAKVWERIATIDREDQDAISYLLRRQIEDREHFYFTDDLPGGGRRFLVYPRRLINSSALGLLGCISFLITTRLASVMPILGEADTMLVLFGVFVMLPWLGIGIAYLRSLRSVIVNAQGITLIVGGLSFKRQNGFGIGPRRLEFAWSALEKICLARSFDAHGHHLSLLFVPKDQNARLVEIDMNQATSVIRARSYLVREISRLFHEPDYLRRESLGLGPGRKGVHY